jgi:hypothetical protein
MTDTQNINMRELLQEAILAAAMKATDDKEGRLTVEETKHMVLALIDMAASFAVLLNSAEAKELGKSEADVDKKIGAQLCATLMALIDLNRFRLTESGGANQFMQPMN